jgi:hypothetical protein
VITEPELAGGADDDGGGAEVIGDDGRGAVRWGAGGAGWVWGVGGMLLASAVWAGGVRWWDAHRDGGPDLHGYALSDGPRDSPCVGGALAPLARAIGATNTGVMAPTQVSRGEAVDRARCTMDAYVPDALGELARFEVVVAIDLHKYTDPRPEFEDGIALDSRDLSPVAEHPVDGLGDLAVLQVLGEQSRQLLVLDGGAVFSLTVTGFADSPVSEDTRGALHGGTRTGASDPARWESAMVAAMREVMKGQQRTSR